MFSIYCDIDHLPRGVPAESPNFFFKPSATFSQVTYFTTATNRQTRSESSGGERRQRGHWTGYKGREIRDIERGQGTRDRREKKTERRQGTGTGVMGQGIRSSG